MMSLIFVFASALFAQAQQSSVDELIATVKGQDAVHSAEAIKAISRLKPTSDLAIQTLLDSLSDDRLADYQGNSVFSAGPQKTVGGTASDALVEIGKPAVLPICEFLSQKRDKNVARAAIRSLSKMKGDAIAALPTLQRLLRSPELEIRFETIYALVSVQQDRRELSSLLGSVLSDKSPDVRAAAIRELGDLGEAGARNAPGLVKLLDDQGLRMHYYTPDSAGQRPVRFDVAQALAKMGPEARVALPKLRAVMNQDPHWLVRVAAAYAVAKLDHVAKDAVECLIAALTNQENGSDVLEESALVLGELGPPAKAALPALVGALQSPESLVRIRAADALALISPEGAEPHLFKLLRDEDGLVRASAIESVAALRKASPQFVNAYIAALDDSDPAFGTDVRRAAAEALGQLRKQATSALPRLQRIVQEETNGSVKDAAVEAIRRITQDRPEKDEQKD